MKIAVSFCALLCLACSAIAEMEPPPVVIDGLNALSRNGGKAALDAWFANSAPQTPVSPQDIDEIAKYGGGRMIGYETIKVIPISASMARVYVLIKYEKNPVFACFDCYKPDTKWLISFLRYGADATAILPERILSGIRK